MQALIKFIRSKWLFLLIVLVIVLIGGFFVWKFSQPSKTISTEPSPIISETDVIEVTDTPSPQPSSTKLSCSGTAWKEFCIVGSDDFVNNVQQALNVMLELSPERYELSKKYAYHIREVDKLISSTTGEAIAGHTWCHGYIELSSGLANWTGSPTMIGRFSWVIAHEAEHGLPGFCTNNAHEEMLKAYDGEYLNILNLHFGSVKINNFETYVKKGEEITYNGRLMNCGVNTFKFSNNEAKSDISVGPDGEFSIRTMFNQTGKATLGFSAYDSSKYWDPNTYNKCGITLIVWAE